MKIVSMPYPKCEVIDNKLIMAIGFDKLLHAANSHPDFWDGKSGLDKPNIKVTNLDAFAKAVADAFNEESEDGSTLLTRIIDVAITNAVESGCDGVNHD